MCGPQCPAPLIYALCSRHPPCFISTSSFLSVYFLSSIAHPACAVSVLHLPSSRFLFFFLSYPLWLVSVSSSFPRPVPFVRPHLSAFSSFLRIFHFLRLPKHLCISQTQMNLRARFSPLRGLAAVRHDWGLYIYFIALSWSLLLMLLWNDLNKHPVEKRRSFAVAQDSAWEQQYGKGEESPLYPWPSLLHCLSSYHYGFSKTLPPLP